MTARAHLSNVVQFPLDGRPLVQVIERQLLPVRFALLDGQQEPALVFRESRRRPLEKLCSGGLELIRFNQPVGHAREVMSEKVFNGLSVRDQQLGDRTVMAGKVGDECLPNFIWNLAGCLQVHEIKQIARMLPIQCRAQLAAVEVRGMQPPQLQATSATCPATGTNLV